MKPKTLVIRSAGTNCDIETANAFNYAGAKAEIRHIGEILKGKVKLGDYSILALPGGFSYGDYVSAGKILSLKIRKMGKDFAAFIKSGKPLIGICNGFQVLVKTGLLPESASFRQTATLAENDGGRFICDHVRIKINKKSPCIFTRGLPENIVLPIAHGEGKFAAPRTVIERIEKKNLNALLYLENPNGSDGDIAGVCNPSGNCLGLMPHPERKFLKAQNISGFSSGDIRDFGWRIFKNAVDYVK